MAESCAVYAKSVISSKQLSCWNSDTNCQRPWSTQSTHTAYRLKLQFRPPFWQPPHFLQNCPVFLSKTCKDFLLPRPCSDVVDEKIEDSGASTYMTFYGTICCSNYIPNGEKAREVYAYRSWKSCPFLFAIKNEHTTDSNS